MLKKKSEVKVVQNTRDLQVREYFVKKDIDNLGLSIAVLVGQYGDNRNNKVDQII